MTSSNFSRNNGTIRILTHFLAINHSKLPISEKKLYCSVVSITLHITCAFQVIKLPNERVIALFITFSYNFYISLNRSNTTTSRPPVPCISQILTTLNCILIYQEWVYKTTISKRSDKQRLRFK